MTNETEMNGEGRLELDPGIRKGLEFIERNKVYLEEEGVIGGERTVRGMVDEFYDLGEYEDSFMIPGLGGGRVARYTCFGNASFGDTKIGKVPPVELISFLDEIGDEPIASSQASMQYENVKESFEDSDAPKGTAWRAIGGLAGILIGAGVPIVASVFAEKYGLETFQAICYGVVGFAGGMALATKTMLDNLKVWESVEQLHSERTEESRMAYQELEVRASQADRLIGHYLDLFQGNE